MADSEAISSRVDVVMPTEIELEFIVLPARPGPARCAGLRRRQGRVRLRRLLVGETTSSHPRRGDEFAAREELASHFHDLARGRRTDFRAGGISCAGRSQAFPEQRQRSAFAGSGLYSDR